MNVDFPVWMIRLLDKEAKRPGVPRQAIIKVWIGQYAWATRGKGAVNFLALSFRINRLIIVSSCRARPGIQKTRGFRRSPE